MTSFHGRVQPQYAEGLALLESMMPSPTEPSALPAFRAWFHELVAGRAQPPSPSVDVRDEVIASADGAGSVALRIVRPKDADGPLPVVYWIPGGGMVVCGFESARTACEALAVAARCAVVAVHYRVAPETPYPGPVEDCYSGLCWVREHAGALALDASKIAVVGLSAGGGLAAATTLLTRDRGGPRIALQVLAYPMLDDRDETPSAAEFAGIPVWSRESNRFGWSSLLGDARGSRDVSAYAAPARAESLAGLPPALVQVAELDVLRDEDIRYAQRLMQAGVPTRLHVYPGAYHAFEASNPASPGARQAVQERMHAIAEAFQEDDDKLLSEGARR